MIRPSERLARRHPQINKLGQRGLALLDVLLGMAIFALIAVIAVQAMGQFRERAYVTQVTSDVKQLSTGIEAGLTEPGATWESLGLPETGAISGEALAAAGVNLTGDNTVRVLARTGDAYAICAEHPDGAWAAYSSTGGAIHSTGRSGGCPAVLAIDGPDPSAGTLASGACTPGTEIVTSNATVRLSDSHAPGGCALQLEVTAPWDLFPSAGLNLRQDGTGQRTETFILEVRDAEGEEVTTWGPTPVLGQIEYVPGRDYVTSGPRAYWDNQVTFSDQFHSEKPGVYTYTATLGHGDFYLSDDGAVCHAYLACDAGDDELVQARTATVTGSFEITG